jgi:hypothetical protein
VPFGRPRNLDLSSTAAFGELVKRIRHHFPLSGDIDETRRQAQG